MNEQFSTQKITKQGVQETLRRRRTITVSLITSLSFLVMTAIFLQRSLTSDTPNYLSLVLTIPISIIGLFCALLTWRNQTTAAGYLLLGTILILSLCAPFVGKGQGIAVGLVVAILGIGIASNTLPQNHVARAIWLSIAFGVAVILIDQVIPDFGLEYNPVYANVSAAIIFVVFVIVSAQRYPTFTLRAKLIIAFAVVMILPLLILGIYNNYVARSTHTEESRDQLTRLSKQVAQQFDRFFIEHLNQISTDAKQTALIDYLSLPSTDQRGSIEESKARQTLLTFQHNNREFIDSYAILDRQGKNILNTSQKDLGRDESKESYFRVAMESGLPYVSNVEFTDETGNNIYFSAPIKDNDGNILGILRAQYQAAILQSLAEAVAPQDPNIIIAIADRDTYLRLAYTGNHDYLFKTYKGFTELELAALQAEGRVPQGSAQEILIGADDTVKTGIDRIEKERFLEAYSETFKSNALATGKYLSTQPWIALASESVASNLEAVRLETRNTIFISLALAGFAILLALGASQILAAPLVSLTKVAELISAGDITARAEESAKDEIGALSNSFNRMTDELNRTLSTLEERVTERTTDLEMARLQSEKRANELTVIGEISKVISSEQKIETLLPLVTHLVSDRLNFYHTGIFLLDETGQFAVLQAANSEGGNRMLARGHRPAVGEGGIVGYVAKFGTPRIALDIGQDVYFFDNPDLQETRSEISLPLIARGQILGVLDVQSTQPGAFTDSDINTLGILADQIAIAIENARLFQQTQQALNEFQALYQQNVKEGWATFRRDESSIGYQQTLSGGKKLLKPVDTDEIRDAINKGNTLVVQPEGDREDSFIVVPLKLRGQIIGTLKVQAPTKKRRWTKDEINLAGAVSERLSLALENARLIQESQKQVIKEQTISEVTSKIGASIDLNNVLQTAVEELGRAMPGSEVSIRFDSNGKK